MIAFPTRPFSSLDDLQARFQRATVAIPDFPAADFMFSLPVRCTQTEVMEESSPGRSAKVLSVFEDHDGLRVEVSLHLPPRDLLGTDWLDHELMMRGGPTELARIDEWSHQGKLSQVLVDDSGRIHRLSVTKTSGRIFLIDASVPKEQYEQKQEDLLVICSTLNPKHELAEEQRAWQSIPPNSYGEQAALYPSGWNVTSGPLQNGTEYVRLTNLQGGAWRGELNIFTCPVSQMGAALSLAYQHQQHLGFDLNSNDTGADSLPWFEEPSEWQVVESRESDKLTSKVALNVSNDHATVIVWVSVRRELNRLWHSMNERCLQLVTESLINADAYKQTLVPAH